MKRKNKILLLLTAILFGFSSGVLKDNPTRVLAFDDAGVQFVHNELVIDDNDYQTMNGRFESNGNDYYGMVLNYDSDDNYYLGYFTTSSLTTYELVYSTLYNQNSLMGWINNNFRFIELIDATTANQNTLINWFGFTRQNFRSINGWFTFNYEISNINVYMNSYIGFTSNGNHYNYLLINTEVITFGSTQVYNFDNYKWVDSSYRLLYFDNSYITVSVYNLLSSYGVFSFVDVNQDATLRDMFFSFVDVPIYTLSSLLSFELFGLDLFIALGSLLLVLLVFKIIKLFV